MALWSSPRNSSRFSSTLWMASTDRVHIFRGAEKILVREPHRFVIRSAFGFRAGKHAAQVQRLFPPPAQSREIRRIDREK